MGMEQGVFDRARAVEHVNLPSNLESLTSWLQQLFMVIFSSQTVVISTPAQTFSKADRFWPFLLCVVMALVYTKRGDTLIPCWVETGYIVDLDDLSCQIDANALDEHLPKLSKASLLSLIERGDGVMANKSLEKERLNMKKPEMIAYIKEHWDYILRTTTNAKMLFSQRCQISEAMDKLLAPLETATKGMREEIKEDGKRTVLLMNKYGAPTITSAFRVFYYGTQLHVSTAEGCYLADDDILTTENVVLLNRDDMEEEEGDTSSNASFQSGEAGEEEEFDENLLYTDKFPELNDDSELMKSCDSKQMLEIFTKNKEHCIKLFFDFSGTHVEDVCQEIGEITNMGSDQFILIGVLDGKKWEHYMRLDNLTDHQAYLQLVLKGWWQNNQEGQGGENRRRLPTSRTFLTIPMQRQTPSQGLWRRRMRTSRSLTRRSDILEKNGTGNAFDYLMEKLNVAQLSGVICRLEALNGNPDFKLKKASVFMFGDVAIELEKTVEASQLMLDSIGSMVLYGYKKLKMEKEEKGETFTLTQFKKIVELKRATKMGALSSGDVAM